MKTILTQKLHLYNYIIIRKKPMQIARSCITVFSLSSNSIFHPAGIFLYWFGSGFIFLCLQCTGNRQSGESADQAAATGRDDAEGENRRSLFRQDLIRRYMIRNIFECVTALKRHNIETFRRTAGSRAAVENRA